MPPRYVFEKPIEAVSHILNVFAGLKELKGLDAILDKILAESRKLAGADAGTIFLVKDGELHFSHVHNETLLKAEDINQHIYLNATLPIDENSIAGYAAARGEILSFDDAYKIDPAYPCRLNTSFDEKTGYRTMSMLTLPVMNSQRKVTAVMQIINATDDSGRHIPFSAEAKTYISLMANHAASAIETGIMTNELVLRMIRMAEMRDPSETGAHVQRVGAYCAEIFHKLAQRRGMPADELKRRKDLVRIASMLHDVGKVGVPDGILKKPGRLDEQEFAIIKRHTLYGARLFANAHSELDALAKDIALHHHQRYDGKGYPGRVDDIHADAASSAELFGGEDIPLGARITALADVFDALISPRVYKEPWPLEKALDLIRKESGRQFDPEATDAFLSIQDVIEAIRTRFTENNHDKPG